MRYHVEIQLQNITPRGFYNHCKKLLKKTGNGAEGWLSDLPFPRWSKYSGESRMNDSEIMYEYPFSVQYFMAGAYNFIMEFDFDSENHGHGYMFAMEA